MTRVDTKPDIARAIRRSRRTRAALVARRRRLAAVAALLAVSLAGAGTWSIGALTGTDMVEAAVTQAQSLGDLLGRRSPGERTAKLALEPHPNSQSRDVARRAWRHDSKIGSARPMDRDPNWNLR